MPCTKSAEERTRRAWWAAADTAAAVRGSNGAALTLTACLLCRIISRCRRSRRRSPTRTPPSSWAAPTAPPTPSMRSSCWTRRATPTWSASRGEPCCHPPACAARPPFWLCGGLHSALDLLDEGGYANLIGLEGRASLSLPVLRHRNPPNCALLPFCSVQRLLRLVPHVAQSACPFVHPC